MIQQPHFWVFPKEMKTESQRDICTPILTAALAKIRKQCKCPSMNEWIKKIWYIIYNEILFSNEKKKDILPFAPTWMDFEGIMLREISQTEKNKYCMISLICGM